MFTSNHFIWLALCISGIALLTFFSVKFRFSFRTATWVVAGISLASELCKIFTHIDPVTEDDKVIGGVLGAGFLPFHLCSLLIFVFFYLCFCKNETHKELLKSFLVPVALLGATIAMLIPTSGVNFLKPYAYQCFVYHSGIFWYALYLLITKQVKLDLRAYARNMAVLVGLIFSMLWVNSALQQYGTNFFYVVEPPMEGLPLLNMNHGWYAYFFTLLSLVIGAFTLFYLPFIVIDICRKKKAAKQIEYTKEF